MSCSNSEMTISAIVLNPRLKRVVVPRKFYLTTFIGEKTRGDPPCFCVFLHFSRVYLLKLPIFLPNYDGR